MLGLTQEWIEYVNRQLEADAVDIFVEMAAVGGLDNLPAGVDTTNPEVIRTVEKCKEWGKERGYASES